MQKPDTEKLNDLHNRLNLILNLPFKKLKSKDIKTQQKVENRLDTTGEGK